jgi:hypothetical protein
MRLEVIFEMSSVYLTHANEALLFLVGLLVFLYFHRWRSDRCKDIEDCCDKLSKLLAGDLLLASPAGLTRLSERIPLSLTRQPLRAK